jgi:4'-phosphopantetheinyl transferase
MSEADVAVWRVPLDPTRAPEDCALAELSEAERARGALFVTDALRNRWFTAHVALRRILADALAVSPTAIRYAATAEGKPFLDAPNARGLEFNLSDSGDLALIAVSRCGAVGVDVEQFHPLRDRTPLADSFFAEEERAALRALPETERTAAFYRIWARKEAFIKAIGVGIGFGLTRFAVSSDAAAPRLLRIDADARVDRAWQLMDVPVPDGYAGALVTPEGVHRIDWKAWVP